jgi:hypothetical protein
MRWGALMLCLAARAQAADHLVIERFVAEERSTCGVGEGISLRLYVSYLDGDGRVIRGRAANDFFVVYDNSEQRAPKIRRLATFAEPIHLAVAQNPRMVSTQSLRALPLPPGSRSMLADDADLPSALAFLQAAPARARKLLVLVSDGRETEPIEDDP